MTKQIISFALFVFLINNNVRGLPDYKIITIMEFIYI